MEVRIKFWNVLMIVALLAGAVLVTPAQPVRAATTLSAGDLVNQISANVPAAERYSFVFDGTAGYLDHALSTASVSPQLTDVAFWHINADEPSVIDYNTEFKTVDLYQPHAFRASDHDPVVLGLNLVPQVVYIDDDWTGLSNGTIVDEDGLTLTIGSNAFDTIQEGVNAVAMGGMVHVFAGTYVENVLLNKFVSIVGEGSGVGDTVVTSPVSFDSRVGVFQITASGLSEEMPLLLQDLRIQPVAQAGISVGRFTESTGTNVSFLTLDNIFVVGTNTTATTEQERGLYVDLTSTLTHLTIEDSAFNNLAYGWYFQKVVSADSSTVSNVVVLNTLFNHNNLKGLYAEKLTNATFLDCVFSENGYSASGVPSYFLPWMAGVDINLKAGTYQNIAFFNPTVTNNALGEARDGVGMTIKARSDGTTYGAYPAILTNVLIANGTFTGNERGLRIGEPGKNNLGPTNVEIHLNRIFGNDKTYTGTDGSAYGGVINQTTTAANAENNWFGCNEGPTGVDCDSVAGTATGTVDADPWLVLNVTGVPDPVLPGAAFTLTADLTDNSDQLDTTVAGTLPDGPVVTFTPTAYVDPESNLLTLGVATTDVSLPMTTVNFNLCAALDAELVCRLVTSAQPIVTWANDDWTTQSAGDLVDVGGGEMHVFGYDAFLTIQEAVDAVATDGTSFVLAGTYVENVTISKALDLLGPNAAINPNTGVRLAEALVLPPTHDPDPNSLTSAAIIYIEVDDVTIQGLTVDGDNPALEGGVDAIEGIGSYEGVGQIVIENNILQNFTYTGLEFYNFTDSSATTDNYIRYNLFQNIGDTTYNWGIGVLVYNNFYADVTNNVFNVVRTGIQTGNFEKANPGTTGRISNNILNVWRLGIFHNLWYSNASSISVDNNTIHAIPYPGATKWIGILVSSFDLAANTSIVDNVIDIPDTVTFPAPGYTAGINVWNDHTTAPLVIQGGMVTGGDYGIWVNNFEGYNSNANNTSATINGVTIDGAGIGVNVWDSPSNTNEATVTAILTDNTITHTGVGIQISGSQASAQATGNSIDNNVDGVVVSGVASLVLYNNSLDNNSNLAITNNGATLLDASANWLGNFDAAIVAGLISGSVDYTPWVNSPTDIDPVTPGFQGDFSYLNVDDDSAQTGTVGRIQEAVNLVSGSTVYIWPGTYEEQVIAIDKDDLTLYGHDRELTIIKSPLTLANLVGDRKPVVGVESSENVTIQNLTVDGAGRGNANYRFYGVFFYNSSGLINELTVKSIRNEPLNGAQSGVAIYVYNEDGVARSVTATDNLAYDYQKGGLTFNGTGLTAVVQNNTATGAGHTPLIAMNGIQLGFGATGLVEGNITSGNWYTGDPNNGVAAGILLYQAANVTVQNNSVSDSNLGIAAYNSDNLSALSNDIFANDYGLDVSASVGAVARYNRIFANVTAGFYAEFEATANNNWWGCNAGPNDAAGDCDLTEGLVSVDEWLVLTVAADPVAVQPGATAAVEANLVFNSAGLDTSAGGTVPDGILAAFSAPDGGSLLPLSDTTLAGITGTVFTAPLADGAYQLCADVDNEQICTQVLVENIAPLAQDDAYQVDEDTVLNVAVPGLLENDADDNQDALTALLVLQPEHGVLTLNLDGSFSYTPDLNFNGEDSFTYKASDGHLESAEATVTITVLPLNDEPQAVDDAYRVMESFSLEVEAGDGVLANDLEVDGDGVSVSILTATAHGVLSLNADGSFTYTPDSGFYGVDSFEYQLTTYPAGGKAAWTDTALVTITVIPLYRMWLPVISR